MRRDRLGGRIHAYCRQAVADDRTSGTPRSVSGCCRGQIDTKLIAVIVGVGEVLQVLTGRWGSGDKALHRRRQRAEAALRGRHGSGMSQTELLQPGWWGEECGAAAGRVPHALRRRGQLPRR